MYTENKVAHFFKNCIFFSKGPFQSILPIVADLTEKMVIYQDNYQNCVNFSHFHHILAVYPKALMSDIVVFPPQRTFYAYFYNILIYFTSANSASLHVVHAMALL